MNTPFDLPVPTPEALSVSAELQGRIGSEIDRHGGSIPFDEFMRMALYEPGLGYYAAGAAKLGAVGDFVTAPEISSLFGICVARQVAEVLARLGGGDVLEFGAGSGRLAVDVLSALEKLACLPEHYYIAELSADLRDRQRSHIGKTLPHQAPKVKWLDRLPAQPPLRAVVLANEVLDAMPVKRVKKNGAAKWSEMHVTVGGDGFVWAERAIASGSDLDCYIACFESAAGELPPGYVTEINCGLDGWLRLLAETLVAGVVFLIDYGYSRAEYYMPDRMDGTLLCHYRHRAHADPFVNVGLQDITASMDFTAVAEAAQNCGFEVAGYLNQARFLLNLGITEALQSLMNENEVENLRRSQQLKRLVLPGEMGERFKVLALRRGLMNAEPLLGFSAGDELFRL
jgi:SAM-dependent MidA family methyltransferase